MAYYILCMCSVGNLCPTLWNPMDCSPPGSSESPGGSPGKNTGVGSHSLSQGIFPTQHLLRLLNRQAGALTIWVTREATPSRPPSSPAAQEIHSAVL